MPVRLGRAVLVFVWTLDGLSYTGGGRDQSREVTCMFTYLLALNFAF
jgi:hypothetical protein